MKFNKNTDWLKESEDTKDIFADEPLDEIKNDEEQVNEAKTATSKKLLSWNKLSQVKAAIAKADEKAFLKLMDEFNNLIDSDEDFPMTQVKNGKLVFAQTDEPITIDSLIKKWFDDTTLFESTQKNEARSHRNEIDFDSFGGSIEIYTNTRRYGGRHY